MLASSTSSLPHSTITNAIIDSIKIRQDYKRIAPEMSQNEFVALKDSVSQHGLFHAIVVNEDYDLA